MFMPQMQINNQNPAYYNEYQNFYYLNPPQPYQINQQMVPQYMPQSYMIVPKTLEENLNMIYNRGIVNHLIGAFFIKECQERQNNKETKKIPISTVELKDEQGEKNNGTNNKDDNNNSFFEKGENDFDKNSKEQIEEKKEDDASQKEKKEDEEEKENNNDNELKIPTMV